MADVNVNNAGFKTLLTTLNGMGNANSIADRKTLLRNAAFNARRELDSLKRVVDERALAGKVEKYPNQPCLVRDSNIKATIGGVLVATVEKTAAGFVGTGSKDKLEVFGQFKMGAEHVLRHIDDATMIIDVGRLYSTALELLTTKTEAVAEKDYVKPHYIRKLRALAVGAEFVIERVEQNQMLSASGAR
ncbi:MAG: hypothetical protein V1909_01325 [Candidatus Micrarchaeota archaeon]